MKRYVMKQAQRGFAMLEVLLAVIVIAMVSFGVYSLYNSSSESSQAASFQQVVQQVMSGAARYGATNYAVAPNAAALANGNYIPAKIFNDPNIVGPYGVIEYGPIGNAGPQDFSASSNNVPRSQALAICNALGGSYGVFVGAADTASLVDHSVNCATAPYAEGANSMVIFSPKPAMIVATTGGSNTGGGTN